ncbi:hypothetical protein BS17DRAFT_201266 [Gyrodon lividus]|nr:hypothetical protein BS17DRAFT_201266 [Gyrodon lividus]
MWMCLAVESGSQGLFAVSVNYKYIWGPNYADHLYFVVRSSVQSFWIADEGLGRDRRTYLDGHIVPITCKRLGIISCGRSAFFFCENSRYKSGVEGSALPLLTVVSG